MLSAAAVAAALCSVAVAASTAGVAVHHPEGFGPHGRLATIGGPAWSSGSERTAVTGDGRIYVAAVPEPSDASEAVRVRRYLPDGKPDPSFGLVGSLVLEELGRRFRLNELLVDTNGLPYLVGTTADGELVVTRLDEHGGPDPTYGDYGMASLGSLPSTADRPRATIDQENRVIVTAAATVDRLTPDGALDPTFGTAGTVPLPDPDVEGLGVDEDGRVQVALPGEDGKSFRLMRLGVDGETAIRTFRGIGAARAIAVRSNGSTLVLGSAAKRSGDGVTVPLLSIVARAGDRRSHRSFVHFRRQGRRAEVLFNADGDDYLIGAREIVDLEIHPNAPFSHGDALGFFGRNGRVTISSPGELIATGASITDSGGTLLVDGIARSPAGGRAHGFLAKFPAAEHVITYAPESVGG